MSAPKSITITVNAIPIINATANPTIICAGETSTLSANGANSYSWSSGSNTSTDIINIAGTYTVTGTNTTTGCMNTQTVNLIVNTLPTMTVVPTNVLCFGNNTGFVTITTSSNVNLSGSSISNLSAGNYTYVATNTLTGCSINTVITISQPTAVLSVISSTISTNGSCTSPNGVASVTVTGGTPNYIVTWSNNVTNTLTTSGSVATNTVLNTGVHSYTVNDSNGCIASIETFTIDGLTGISTTLTSQTNVSCFNGTNGLVTYTTSGTGPMSYTLTNVLTTNSITNSTGTFANLSAGNYSIVVVGAGGCLDTDILSINQPTSSVVINSVSTNSALCNGSVGTVSINITGGTPTYTINWNGTTSSLTTHTFIAGTYTVSVFDANGCSTSSETFTILEPMPITLASYNINPPCPSQSNGSIDIVIQGGAPSYTVNWSPIISVTTGSVSNLSNIKADNYTAIITDENGCVLPYVVTVDEVQGANCDIKVPELFSPNKDSKNDTWEIIGLNNYPNNSVQIFNRWGSEVYSAKPYNNDWDGKDYGSNSIFGKGDLPVGTYYFILDLGNGSKPIHGYIQLVR